MDLPQIRIKITRKGDRIKFETKDFKLELPEIAGYSQTYDFIALERFVTMVATKEYNKIVKREQIKKDLMSLQEGGDDTIRD